MKQDKKNNNKKDETADFFRELQELLLGSLNELLKPSAPKPQLPPPLPMRPFTVRLVLAPRKKGIIRRFINWIW